ncbi:hypothetical protein [Desulfosporosinus shakirovi]|nr:hypothetical protein [Desulfosporosinus sp. SRJS8]MCB8815275.1 hypothetical protein [Desulfosporosinus sp. SRJS8]
MKRRIFIGLIIMTAVITGLLAGCSSKEALSTLRRKHFGLGLRQSYL